MKKIFIAGALLVLGIFLWWHLRLGLTRYFDVDEFAYLHWAYNLFSGELPYRDFFFYIPPGFLLFLSPIFAFFNGTDPIIAARVAMWVLFGLLCAVSSLVFWEVRKSIFAAAVALILAFLPLPFDKFIEIRPDTLAVLLAMLGLLLQVRKNYFLSGLFYGLSLLVLPKTLPQVLVATVFQGVSLRSKETPFIRFLAGLLLPWIGFAIWSLATGDPGAVWYSIIQLPKEVGQATASRFFMQPDLFFYPNATYYGENGWSLGLLANHMVWTIGLLMGLFRLLVPKNRNELLVAASLYAHVVFFFWFYPLRHAQYLIPIAVFVAWYAADFFAVTWRKLPALPLAGVFILLVVFLRTSAPKLAWDNKEMLATIEKIHATIPRNEYVLDLDGRTLYYQDPYYICCLPFGEFTPFMTKKLPSLAEALKKTRTKYIFQGQLERVRTLSPEDQEYIQKNFRPAVAGDIQLLVSWRQ